MVSQVDSWVLVSLMKHSWVSPRGCSVRELPNSSVVVVPNTGPRDLPTWDGRPDSRGQRTTAPGNSGPTMPSECESAARGQKKRAALGGRSLFTTLNNLCSENSGAGSGESPMGGQSCKDLSDLATATRDVANHTRVSIKNWD